MNVIKTYCKKLQKIIKIFLENKTRETKKSQYFKLHPKAGEKFNVLAQMTESFLLGEGHYFSIQSFS